MQESCITPFLPFSPSLINVKVSVDVKHHVYLLTYVVDFTMKSMDRSSEKQSQSIDGTQTNIKMAETSNLLPAYSHIPF